MLSNAFGFEFCPPQESRRDTRIIIVDITKRRFLITGRPVGDVCPTCDVSSRHVELITVLSFYISPAKRRVFQIKRKR